MADSCCNLRCFSYFVAILTIVGGILQLIQVNAQSIIGGILAIALGCLLAYGIRKRKEKYVLGYVITEGVLLLIALILDIVALTNIDKVHLDPEQKKFLNTLLYSSIGAIVIGFLLLIPVFMYYKQLARESDAQPRPVY